MKKMCFIAMLLVLIISFCGFKPNTVYASDNNTEITDNEDDLETEESTNTFYIPESSFQSYYDYEKYCERMYKNGYMTEDYKWTSDAQNYIDNPTVENSEMLDKSAQELVKDRIENGKMSPEDNPFLTYEERERLKKNNTQKELHNSKNDDMENVPEPDIDEMLEEIEENKDELQEELTGKHQNSNIVQDNEVQNEKSQELKERSNLFEKIILSIIVTVLVLAAYYFYKNKK